MKTITIRLPDVEAAMLVEVQKVDKVYRDLSICISKLIKDKFASLPGCRK